MAVHESFSFIDFISAVYFFECETIKKQNKFKGKFLTFEGDILSLKTIALQSMHIKIFFNSIFAISMRVAKLIIIVSC